MCIYNIAHQQPKLSTPRMNLKVRRLLKGLRYISHVYGEGEEENDEMRIGFPTDVKHVAHIGFNASIARPPSWMKEFKQGNGSIESDTLVAYAHTQGDSSSNTPNGMYRETDIGRVFPKMGPRSTRSGRKAALTDRIRRAKGISSTEESFGSSSQQVIKARAKLHSKQPGIRRRKDSAPVRHKVNASNTQLSDEEPIKPKKTRRRKKNVIKKVAATDDGSLRSSATSSNPNSAPSTDDSGNLDKSKCGSTHGVLDDEGSPESYGTVACVFERDL